MTHIIGPQTAHKLHPDSKRIIEEQMQSLAGIGREQVPSRVSFTTFSLRYHRSYWIDITGMDEHWSQATIDASLSDENRIEVTTTGVRSFEIHLAAGSAPFRNRSKPIDVIVDGVAVKGEPTLIASNRSFHASLIKDQDGWRYGSDSQTLRKRPGLQGPIDDAFLRRFLFVRPTGAGEFPEVDRWIQGELEHALRHWRIHFRGDIRIKNDTDVTDEDIAQNNLILFGTPESNSVIAKCIDRLPLQWKTDKVAIGEQQHDAAFHVPLLVYPNPLATDRYVVLNSGFTYREYDYLNNARQTPKLPDWALIDIRQPANARTPGGVAAADFFDEQWQVKPIK